jgi:hypothetical protein
MLMFLHEHRGIEGSSMRLRMMAVSVAALLVATLSRADAHVVIDISQVGGDVVTTGNGTVNLSDLSPSGSEPASGSLNPQLGGVIVGNEGTVDIYSGVSGPAAFGTGGLATASSISGDLLGIGGSGLGAPAIFVPNDYISGTALSGSATYDGATLASLGLTGGKYVYTWGAGPNADSLTVNIGIGGAVPEPSTWVMMLAGFAGLGYAGYRQRERLARS